MAKARSAKTSSSATVGFEAKLWLAADKLRNNRACLFGDVVDGEMRLNDAGKIVQTTWNEIPSNYLGVEIDESRPCVECHDPVAGAQFIAPDVIAPDVTFIEYGEQRRMIDEYL